jgi:hypothetical protein
MNASYHTANTDVTSVTNGPLLDANGNLTVAPNTTAGTYTITKFVKQALTR